MRTAALAAVAIMVAVGLAELLLRLSPAMRPNRRFYAGEELSRRSVNYVEDSLLGWRMRTHDTLQWRRNGELRWYTSNGQGFRAPMEFRRACGDGPRIALVGDSFVFGVGVNYPGTISAQLQDTLGAPAEVYNFGMAGFAIDQMWMTARHEALEHCPTALVVAFIDDDLTRSLTAFRRSQGFAKPAFLIEADTLRRATLSDRPGLVARQIVRHSALYRLMTVVQLERARSRGSGEWFELNAAVLDAVARDARAAGVPLLFLRFPQLRWRDFPAMTSWMEARHYDYLDLADPARARPEVLLAGDGHFNELGSAWTAGEIAGWLRRRGLAGSAAPAARD